MQFVENMFNLKGRVAAVIGGGGVLAGAMAQGLAQAGADVAILDVNADAANSMANVVREFGVKAVAVPVNAALKEDLLKAAERIKVELGAADILINAAGINSTTPYFDITADEYEKIMAVNLKSVFFACQVFGKEMMDVGKKGSIINISSASSGPPLSKVFTYSLSKAGVNNLTQWLAREWASAGIRVNAIAPGFFPAEQNRQILTPERIADIKRHTPMQRFGEAEELVGAVIWLASEKASSFVTGAIIRVDGGFTAMTI